MIAWTSNSCAAIRFLSVTKLSLCHSKSRDTSHIVKSEIIMLAEVVKTKFGVYKHPADADNAFAFGTFKAIFPIAVMFILYIVRTY